MSTKPGHKLPIEPDQTHEPVDPPHTMEISSDTTNPVIITFPTNGVPGYPFLSPPQEADELGRFGDYRVLAKLGEGGMGFVFRGEELTLKRLVAIKVMRPEVASKSNAADRFLREGRAAAGLKSDHIITIYSANIVNGVPYLAMEFLEGVPMDVWLRNQKKAVPLPHALRIARDTLRGLAVAHEKGLIHRDIKPANLWIEKGTNRIKILDFGLTRSNEADDQLTAEGAVVGTPAYMAPEQASGKPVDPRADLFSVGVVMYTTLAGKNPFSRGVLMETLGAINFDQQEPITTVRDDVPKEYSDFLDRLLAKKPDGRPANTKAALQELLTIEKKLQEVTKTAASTVSAPVLVAVPLIDMAPQVWGSLTDDEGIKVRNTPSTEATRSLPGAVADAPPRKPMNKLLLLGCLFGFIALVLGGITIIITNKDGTKTTVEVPDGAKVEVKDKGKTVATVGGKKDDVAKKDVLKPSVTVNAGPLPPLPKFTYTPVAVGQSPFDKLDATAIPKAEKFDWQPKELVAVLGSRAGRMWHGGGVAISPDGKTAIMGGHQPIIWDMATRKPRGQIAIPQWGHPFGFSP
ncbi:MAG: protein kinase domain-containing protein, partial [Gemmataceae bacterium]